MSGFWLVGKGTVAEGKLTLSNENLQDYLFRESGAMQQLKHTEQALRVASNPAASLAAYEEALQKATLAGVEKYKGDVEFLLAQGLPGDKAESLALQKITEELQRERAFISLQFPLINDESKLMDIVAKVKL